MECLSNLFCSVLFTSYSILGFLVVRPLGWLFLPVVKYFFKKKAEKLGLIINGERPIDPKIVNDRICTKVLTDWNLAAFEGMVEGDVVIEDMSAFLELVFKSKAVFNWEHPLHKMFQWFNLQTPTKAWEVGEKHYNLGIDLWEAMLGKYMVYSNAYWKDSNNLDEAQEAEMHLIARKMKLKPGMRVLDIGCGWGDLAIGN